MNILNQKSTREIMLTISMLSLLTLLYFVTRNFIFNGQTENDIFVVVTYLFGFAVALISAPYFTAQKYLFASSNEKQFQVKSAPDNNQELLQNLEDIIADMETLTTKKEFQNLKKEKYVEIYLQYDLKTRLKKSRIKIEELEALL